MLGWRRQDRVADGGQRQVPEGSISCPSLVTRRRRETLWTRLGIEKLPPEGLLFEPGDPRVTVTLLTCSLGLIEVVEHGGSIARRESQRRKPGEPFVASHRTERTPLPGGYSLRKDPNNLFTPTTSPPNTALGRSTSTQEERSTRCEGSSLPRVSSPEPS